MTDPLVSVVIPAYNCERFIEESVRSALAQTMGDLEVIAIDDSSTDGTYGVLSELAGQDERIRLLKNEKNIGVADTRNRAFGEARGRYVALLDGDDIWLPDKLEKQLQLMDKKQCDFCYTAYSFIDESGQAVGRTYQVPAEATFKRMLVENVIGCSTVLLKAELLRQYRMRREYAHEDYVLWLELLRDGYKACGAEEIYMQYRLLENSRSNKKRKAARSRWKVYRTFLGKSFFPSLVTWIIYVGIGIHKHFIVNEKLRLCRRFKKP